MFGSAVSNIQVTCVCHFPTFASCISCLSVSYLCTFLFPIRNIVTVFCRSVSSSCLQGARLAGRDARRSYWTDTRKLCGVFIIQGLKRLTHLSTKAEWRWLDLTAQDGWNVYWTGLLLRQMLSWADWDLKLDQAEPYHMVVEEEERGADWTENNALE